VAAGLTDDEFRRLYMLRADVVNDSRNSGWRIVHILGRRCSTSVAIPRDSFRHEPAAHRDQSSKTLMAYPDHDDALVAA
jgi:hypothetical protein